MRSTSVFEVFCGVLAKSRSHVYGSTKRCDINLILYTQSALSAFFPPRFMLCVHYFTQSRVAHLKLRGLHSCPRTRGLSLGCKSEWLILHLVLSACEAVPQLCVFAVNYISVFLPIHFGHKKSSTASSLVSSLLSLIFQVQHHIRLWRNSKPHPRSTSPEPK